MENNILQQPVTIDYETAIAEDVRFYEEVAAAQEKQRNSPQRGMLENADLILSSSPLDHMNKLYLSSFSTNTQKMSPPGINEGTKHGGHAPVYSALVGSPSHFPLKP